ncbi:MAG: hypothetical protein L0Y66_12295 [Myxococcaceae bacterium]|nr:hypothetical protein [Myxococcaceae bacterium]MCI0669615.1 hypothetical protein [Myxococcaceae bacterium]
MTTLQELWGHAGFFARMMVLHLFLGIPATGLLAVLGVWKRPRRSSPAEIQRAPEGGICALHDREAVSTCTRCGAFLCVGCSDVQRCQACMGRLSHVEAETRRVIVPAGLLVLFGGVSAAFWMWSFLTLLQTHPDVAQQARAPLDVDTERALTIRPLLLLAMSLAFLSIWGGVEMWRRRRWGLAVTAAAVALVPCCGPLGVLGTPVGAWALLVLLEPEVRRAFERGAQRPFAGG